MNTMQLAFQKAIDRYNILMDDPEYALTLYHATGKDIWYILGLTGPSYVWTEEAYF